MYIPYLHRKTRRGTSRNEVRSRNNEVTARNEVTMFARNNNGDIILSDSLQMVPLNLTPHDFTLILSEEKTLRIRPFLGYGKATRMSASCEQQVLYTLFDGAVPIRPQPIYDAVDWTGLGATPEQLKEIESSPLIVSTISAQGFKTHPHPVYVPYGEVRSSDGVIIGVRGLTLANPNMVHGELASTET